MHWEAVNSNALACACGVHAEFATPLASGSPQGNNHGLVQYARQALPPTAPKSPCRCLLRSAPSA